MNRHETMQLKVKDKVIIQSGLYAGKVGVIESIDASAQFPNGSVRVQVDGTTIKFSGSEITRYMGKDEEFTEDPLSLLDEDEEFTKVSDEELDEDELLDDGFDEGEV